MYLSISGTHKVYMYVQYILYTMGPPIIDFGWLSDPVFSDYWNQLGFSFWLLIKQINI